MVLHAHLPFVRHPEHERFLEEDWLFEAITETYIPLIEVFERLTVEKIDFRITMSLTPTLCAMLSDALLQNRYENYLDSLIELSEKESKRTAKSPQLNEVARMYETKLKRARFLFNDKYNRNLVNAFKEYQDLGKLEIITCCATHGYLPLMLSENSKRAQIKTAVTDYTEKFGRKPRGIWLAECGYYPGDDEILKNEHLKYFFTDTHGIIFGKPRPRYGVFAPIYCPSGVAAFGRDMESSQQVWSADTGYPGDFRYREFYRDLGYDADYDYIRPYLHNDGIRTNIGLKYYKITGDVPLHSKEVYSPQQAIEAAAEHAGNFMFNREKQIENLRELIGKKPIVVSPYDAELFGHWWYEGPTFLEYLFRKIHYDQKSIKLITPSEYLQKYPVNQVMSPSMSSWGDKGYNEFWLNGSNDWVYRHLHKISERMTELAKKHARADDIQKRALNQAAREVLLAQSSDWAFILTSGTMTNYAVKKITQHINRFHKLYYDINSSTIDENWLADIEYKDNIFPHIDYKDYS